MSSFIPDQPKKAADVPYFDDVTSDGGWKGQSTSKSIETLKAEIVQSVARLGGLITGFQKGTFEINGMKRGGFRVMYNLEAPSGEMVPGRIDVAALPVRPGKYGSIETRREKSLKMTLFMLRDSFDGLWFLQQLSPGYAALMPFLLMDGKSTVTQLWSENAMMKNLLPPGSDDDFIEGEAKPI